MMPNLFLCCLLLLAPKKGLISSDKYPKKFSKINLVCSAKRLALCRIKREDRILFGLS